MLPTTASMKYSPSLSRVIPPSSNPWGKAVRIGMIAYVLSRVFVLMGVAVAVAAQAVWARLNNEEPPGGLSGLVEVLNSWDGHWYMEVARSGYPHHIMPNVTYFVSDARAAFFPLYPRVVHYLDNVWPGGPVSIALLLNIVLGGVFVLLTGVIARRLFDVKTAQKTMILVALFPGSFVLSWAYSEAMLLTLAALCFLALHRHMWLIAGILAAFGTAARPNGLALVAACAVAALIAIKEDREWKALIAPALAPVGFIGFMLFLRHHTGENLAWFRIQREAWQEGTSFGATAVTRTFDFFMNPTSSPTSLLTAASMIALIIGVVALWKYQIPMMYIAYSVVIIVLMLIPDTVTARPRFLFTAFPLLIPVARMLRDDEEKWWPVVVLVMATGLVTVTGMYGVRAAIP